MKLDIMKTGLRVVATVALLAMVGGAGNAQSTATPEAANREEAKFFRLDFVVKEVDGGKVLTARNYSMVVSTAPTQFQSQIRAGSKVRIDGNYLDIGTNVDCSKVKDVQADLAMQLTVEVSSLLQDLNLPVVIRQNKWSSDVIIPLKKPTIVFSSDDNTTKRVLQLEVTATPRL